MIDLRFGPGQPTATRLLSLFVTKLEEQSVKRTRRHAADLPFNSTTMTTVTPKGSSLAWLVNASVANSNTKVDVPESGGFFSFTGSGYGTYGGIRRHGKRLASRQSKYSTHITGPPFLL